MHNIILLVHAYFIVHMQLYKSSNILCSIVGNCLINLEYIRSWTEIIFLNIFSNSFSKIGLLKYEWLESLVSKIVLAFWNNLYVLYSL